MVLDDKAIGRFIDSTFRAGHYIIPIVLALLVVFIGKKISKKKVLPDQMVPEEMESAV
jgi:hypothetical protein